MSGRSSVPPGAGDYSNPPQQMMIRGQLQTPQFPPVDPTSSTYSARTKQANGKVLNVC